MARSLIPDALGMRRLKYDPSVTDAERDATAAALRKAGRIPEAIFLYEGRPSHPSLAEDLRASVKAGASFTLKALERIGVTVGADAWRACASAAEDKGRWYDALRCYEILKDEPALARVREKLPGFKIAVPDNKK
jgi:hypothetical protein